MALPPNPNSNGLPDLGSILQQGASNLQSTLSGAGPAGNYISPQQLESLRNYAQALNYSNSKTPVKNGWGGIGQVLNSAVAGMAMNRANNLQGQMFQQKQAELTPSSNQIMSFNGAPTQPLPPQGSQTPQGSSPTPGTLNPDDYPNTPDGHSAFNHDYAVSKGIDPSLVNNIASAEGNNPMGWKTPNQASAIDIDPKTGQPFSFGDFQLNVRNGLGNSARAAGIDPADPKQWQAANSFAIDHMANNDLSPWKGDAAVEAYRKQTGQQDYSTPKITPQLPKPIQVASLNPAAGIPPPIPTPQPHLPVSNPGIPQPVPSQPMQYNPAVSGPGTMGASPMVQALRGSGAATSQGATPPPVTPAVVQALQGQTTTQPPGTPPPPVPQPQQVAQSSPMMTSQQYSAVMADDRIDQGTKDSIRAMYAPQNFQGALGSTYQTTPARSMNGMSPQLVFSGGQVVNNKVGSIETPTLAAIDKNGGVSAQPMNPGAMFQMPSLGNPNNTQSPTPTPTPQSGRSGPNTSYGDYIKWGQGVTARGEGLNAAAKEQNEKLPIEFNDGTKTAQLQLNNLQQLQTLLQKLGTEGGSKYFGPGGPKAQELMGYANQLGLSSDAVKNALSDLEQFTKDSNRYLGSTIGSSGLHGHVTDLLQKTFAGMAPQNTASYTGNLHLVDSLIRASKFSQMYNEAGSRFIGKYGSLINDKGNDFGTEFENAVTGKGSEDPTMTGVRPMVLSRDGPTGSYKGPNGTTKVMTKAPSTHAQGFKLIDPADPDPDDH